MIPKVIHYCWFGRGEMPDLTLKCIASWKKYLPEYEIILWNEDNFDVNSYQYALEAYKENKFAFVADVCRLHVLKSIGGIYMDTDVEFIKPLAPEMLNDVAFTGFEDKLVSAGIMGSVRDGQWVSDLLSFYDGKSFYLADGGLNINPITETITAIMKEKKSLINDNTLQNIPNYCTIYPSDYFYPKSWITLKTTITANTYCIHHFAASWLHNEYSFMGKVANLLLGKRIANLLSKKYRDIKAKK